MGWTRSRQNIVFLSSRLLPLDSAPLGAIYGLFAGVLAGLFAGRTDHIATRLARVLSMEAGLALKIGLSVGIGAGLGSFVLRSLVMIQTPLSIMAAILPALRVGLYLG